MIETVLDRIRPPFDDRPFYFAPDPLAVAFVDQLVIMFFITAKFAFLETEDRFQLLAPGDSTGRDIALPDAHPAALHRHREHHPVFVEGLLNFLPACYIAGDLRGTDNAPRVVADRRYS